MSENRQNGPSVLEIDYTYIIVEKTNFCPDLKKYICFYKFLTENTIFVGRYQMFP